jgi:hypothetical protein
MGNPLFIPGSGSSRRETRAGFDKSRTEDRIMKRFLLAGLAAVGLAMTAAPAMADFCLNYNVCRNLCITHTQRCRCFSYHSYCNPLPCCAPGCGPTGPALWNSLAAYGPQYPNGYAAAAQPAAATTTAPAATQPSFNAPQPSPATNGVKQAVYSYGQTASPNYDTSSGYSYYGATSGYSYYGYGAGYNYAQAPNYWY